MKRDPDAIRQIALATEDLPAGHFLQEVNGMDPAVFAEHVQWMLDADLVEGKVQRYMGGSPPTAFVMRLTWTGCDFLDAARSDTLWKKARGSVISPTASWTFDILKDWLKQEIRQGLPTLRGLAQ